MLTVDGVTGSRSSGRTPRPRLVRLRCACVRCRSPVTPPCAARRSCDTVPRRIRRRLGSERRARSAGRCRSRGGGDSLIHCRTGSPLRNLTAPRVPRLHLHQLDTQKMAWGQRRRTIGSKKNTRRAITGCRCASPGRPRSWGAWSGQRRPRRSPRPPRYRRGRGAGSCARAPRRTRAGCSCRW